MYVGKLLKGKPFRMIDTTTKSGVEFLAPGWDIVLSVKADPEYQPEYISIYKKRLRHRYSIDKLPFLDIINNQLPVVFLCYCGKDKFCHRFLLVDVFRSLCEHYDIDFEYLGELHGIASDGSPSVSNDAYG